MTTKSTRPQATARPLTRTLAACVGSSALLAGAALGATLPASAAPAPTAAAAAGAITTSTASDPVPTHAPIGTPNTVGSWYTTFLDREAADDAGSEYWVDRVNATDDPQGTLLELLRTREYVSGAVDTVYGAYLDRDVDAGARYWVDGVVDGEFPLEWVEQNVAASDEVLLRSSDEGSPEGEDDDATSDGPERLWFNTVLDRDPTFGEEKYIEDQIEEHGALSAFRELWYSQVAIDTRVQSHYTNLLQRSASDGELAYWSDQEAASDITVVAAIATSSEFKDRFPL